MMVCCVWVLYSVNSIAELTGNKPISFITYIVFEQHNLFELCSVNKNILANFLYFLDIGYHRNPYVSTIPADFIHRQLY